MTDTPPDIPVVPARRSLWDRVSIIWLVPVAALIIALSIAWQNYSNRGPLIEITFADGSGIAPGETQLRFRDVAVGVVESLEFSPEFDRVIVRVRLEPEVADYVDSDATFWVVRPQVTTQGISGLETVLSGVYIKGQWDVTAGGLTREFEGLADAPLMSADELGTVVILRSTTGSLQGNVPLVYKGVEVGRVGPARVTTDGLAVEAEAVVLSPWDALLTESTRFFNVSGFSLSLGTGGASINFESAATLLVGGISFDTWVSGAPLAQPNDTFVVYGDSDTARSSVFNRLDGAPLYLSAVFEGNVTGLAIGAPVELDGLRIGEVTGITGITDREAYGDGRVRLLTQFSVQPARLGFDGEDGPDDALALLQEQVAGGLRARLVTGSILNGALKVQLTTITDLPPGEIDLFASPYPSVPVAQSEIADIQATAQGTLDRINALPIEELLSSAAQFLDGAAVLVSSEDVQNTPGDIRRVIASVEAITASDELQAIPARIDAAIAELEGTLTEARELVAALNQGDAANRVLTAVDSTGAVMEDARGAIAGLPSLIANVDAFVAVAQTLPLQGITTEAETLIAEARTLIANEDLQGLPARADATIAELEATLAEARELVAALNEGDAANRVLAAVDSTGAVMEEARNAIAGLPGLVENADALIATARALPLDGIATGAEGLIADARTLIGSEEAQALPGQVSTLLTGATGTLDDIRQSGLVANSAAAVTDLRSAITDVSTAAEGLPDLVNRAAEVLTTVEESTAGLPELVADAGRVAEGLAAADIGGLVERSGTLVGQVSDFVATAEVQALPGRVNTLLGEVTEMAGTLNEAGVAERLSSTLTAVEQATARIATATEGLPALMNQAGTALATANTTLASLGDLSQTMRDVRTALREISRAADAVASLATRLERNPNSLIFGN